MKLGLLHDFTCYCLGVVDRLAVPVVLPGQVECPALLEHPEAEESLDKVVDMSRYSVDIQ